MVQRTVWNPGSQVRMDTEGLLLRSLSAADAADSCLEHLREPDIAAGLGLAPVHKALTAENVAKLMEGFDNRVQFLFGIFWSDTGECIGFLRARLDWGGVAMVSLALVDRNLWRSDLPAVAMYIARRFLFETLKVHKIAVRLLGGNADAEAGLAKGGYKPEGRLREAEPDGKGGRRDVLLFGLLRSEAVKGPPIEKFDPPAH